MTRIGLAAAIVSLLAAPLTAQESITAVIGQPVLALAQRPEMTTVLRFNSGGHRTAVAARVRDPGPPVALADDRYVYGFGCRPQGGCREGGVFLAFDVHDERVFMLLTEAGSVRLSVPPDPRSWPEGLRSGVAEFIPALAEAMGGR
ncbi:hypothetical protein GXW78_15560 [Roseomonas terrae]|uniref:YbjN domain-containing protein n=1 Tax=Neoroseomonas terrae TaxID=424799 RepID=A0ABS5EJ93_9PROT|nr:hypothetical protein [Neoroseomonas terrae]MBR0651090.1 hypothetical protein [Neoroseomonas terrae]